MLRFVDGYDYYATTEFQDKYSTLNISTFTTTITVGAFGRNGTNGGKVTWNNVNAFVYLQRTLTFVGSTIVMGIGFNPSLLGASGALNPLFAVLDGATVQCSVCINADGTLSVCRGASNGTVLGTTSSGISTSTYSYIEFKVTLSTTVGTYDIQINNVNVLSGTGANTANAGTTSATAVRLFYNGGGASHVGSSAEWSFDDFYVCDGSGSDNNDFLGPVRILTTLPASAGSHTDFTPLSGSNFENVDETSTDDDTTYNTATVSGAIDTYTMGALLASGTILGVQTNLIVRSAGAGSELIRPVFVISGVDYPGTTVGVATTYADAREAFDTSPATGSAWLSEELTEVGLELVN